MEKLLKNLCSIIGPSGFEINVQKFILNEIRPYIDEFWIDAIGNLIVKIEKNSKNNLSILIDAHSDEVGFIVKKIESDGFIKFEKIGSIDDRRLQSQEVSIQTDKEIINGVIGLLSKHYTKWDDINRITPYYEMYIDIGATSRECAENMGVRIGQPITFNKDLKFIGDRDSNRLYGKGIDNRAGCAVLIQLLKSIKTSQIDHGDIYGVFSVQEEVGHRGIKALNRNIKIDIAIVIDTGPSSDTCENIMDGNRKLGEGPLIKVMDNCFIANQLIKDLFIDIAERNGIPYQLDIFIGAGTNAGDIYLSRDNIFTGVLSIPSRYMHSPVEVVDMSDLYNTVLLLQKFLFESKNINLQNNFKGDLYE